MNGDDDWVWVRRFGGRLFINNYQECGAWPCVYPEFYTKQPAWNESVDKRFDSTTFFKVRRPELDALLAMERARLAMEGGP